MIAVSKQVSRAMVTSMNRNNDQRQQKLTVFHKAVEIVEQTSQWPNGQNKTVFSGKLAGKPAQVYLSNEGGWINLHLFVEGKSLMDRFYSKPYTIGLIDVKTGIFKKSNQANEGSYLAWNLKTRGEMR